MNSARIQNVDVRLTWSGRLDSNQRPPAPKLPCAGLGDAALPREHSAGNGKALRRTIRRSAREGGSGCDFRLSRRRNHLASRRFRRRRLPTRTGSIGQYGAGSQVIHEIRAKQASGASLATTSGRDESERVDAGWVGAQGGSLGALGQGVGGGRYAATALLSPPSCEGPRRERLGPRILNDRWAHKGALREYREPLEPFGTGSGEGQVWW